MKVQFCWKRLFPKGTRARDVARKLNEEEKRSSPRWKGWSWTDREYEREWNRTPETLETLEVEVQTLRGSRILSMMYTLEDILLEGHPVIEVRLNGMDPLNFSVWAEDQIRKLRKQIGK